MAGLESLAFGVQLQQYTDLARQVISQTYRRVLKGEKVSAAEKIVSIFEHHTDIIVKDRHPHCPCFPSTPSK
jgi:IS5 family transposase